LPNPFERLCSILGQPVIRAIHGGQRSLPIVKKAMMQMRRGRRFSPFFLAAAKGFLYKARKDASWGADFNWIEEKP
jgi:hypothetical protein